jgi:hypothetical protein
LALGPVYGAAYVAAGVLVVVLAEHTRGIVQYLLDLVAFIFLLAGAWTILVTGGMLLLILGAELYARLKRPPRPGGSVSSHRN